MAHTVHIVGVPLPAALAIVSKGFNYKFEAQPSKLREYNWLRKGYKVSFYYLMFTQ